MKFYILSIFRKSAEKIRVSLKSEKNNILCRTVSIGDRGRVAQWLMRCATNRKVTGSIPDGVTGIFD